MQRAVRDIYVDPAVADYIVRLVGGTRDHGDIYLGASPRGSIALYRAGQALAGLLGRDYVIPDDVKALAEAALAHRLIIKTSSSIHDVQPAQVIRELLDTTSVGAVRETAIPSVGAGSRADPHRRIRQLGTIEKGDRANLGTGQDVPSSAAADPRRDPRDRGVLVRAGRSCSTSCTSACSSSAGRTC